MASVATCPYCYLRLVVPIGFEPDERVECPTCAKEFGLGEVKLSPMPEVVRRSLAAPTAEPVATSIVADEIDEIVIEEQIAEMTPTIEIAPNDEAARYVEEVKARIESEISAGGLFPGSNASLSLDTPDLSLAPTEDAPVAENIGDPLAAFRNAKTVAELPAYGDEVERQPEDRLDVTVDDIPEKIDEQVGLVEETANVAAELAMEPDESCLPQPTVRTLADWMQPREDVTEHDPIAEPVAAEIAAEVEDRDEAVEEVEASLGPSFELPNVPLVPSTGATVEFEPSMSFGPAAETEFELEDVNFESAAAEEPVADEFSDDAAEESEPVFPESQSEMPAAPFVLPGVPRARKQRSIVRVLVGTALGGVVGVLAASYILLWLLGPDGDLLYIAKFIPSSVLPESFQTPAPIAQADPPATSVEETTPAPVDVASDEVTGQEDKSANILAGYVEETPTDSGQVVTAESDDDRYATEPAPLEEPSAEPIAQETPVAAVPALPLQGPKFSVDDLAKAIQAGKTALAGLAEGDLSDEAVRRTKGASYEKLAELAEALTFVDTSSPSIESEDATNRAIQLFSQVFSNPHTRNEIGKIVTIWIPSPHRKNSGVFFAGTATGGQIVGDVYEYQVSTEAGSKFALLCRDPLESSLADSGRQFGVVGAIVDNQAQNVTGYSGTSERAIWLTRAIPLD